MTKSIRYFVALLPPQSVQDYAAGIIRELTERYHTRTSKSPPHITLQPPFLWSEDSVRLETELRQFASRQPNMPIHLSGYGAFVPRVLYINVLPTPELMQLQAKLSRHLEAELEIVDPMSKQRSFTPHLTVASRDLTRQTFKQSWAELQSCPLEFEFVVTHLTLLVSTGQRWQIQTEFPLELESGIS
jgi:2'-5' RNA ligase